MQPILAMYSAFDFRLMPEDEAAVRAIAPGYELRCCPFEELKAEELAQVEVVFGNPAPSLMKSMPALRFHQLQSAGSDAYCAPSTYAREDVVLCSGSGTYGLPISEHVMAMMLSLGRNLSLYRDQQRDKLWRSHMNGFDLSGSTVLIAGLGDIGQRVAKLCAAFGMHVLGVKRSVKGTVEGVDELYAQADIDTLLPRANVLVLCLPSTAETEGLLTRERLFALRHGCLLLNVGRGNVLDQEALIEALRSGHIGGAGLDVTIPEPLPPESPLWEMENVILTSHSSGRSPSNKNRCFGSFLDNLRRYTEGEPLCRIVDRNLRY